MLAFRGVLTGSAGFDPRPAYKQYSRGNGAHTTTTEEEVWLGN